MLQGTFETLSLPEVLGLLASARKSGALRLEAGPVSGLIHLEDGNCRAVETAELRDPVAGAPELLSRLVDVCFAVTRQEIGAFRFAAEEVPPWRCDEPVQLSDALVEVDRLLKQWREILRVIPSLECRPRLLEALTSEEILVDRDTWALLVGVDGRRTVRELVQHVGRPVIDVCQSLLELVEAGALGVVDPAAAAPAPEGPAPEVPARAVPAPAAPVAAAAPAPAPVAAPAPAPVPAPAPAPAPEPAPVAPAPRVPEPAMAMATAKGGDAEGEDERSPLHEDGADAPDKGAFLRLFSGLRES